jgi:hypothetical protein
MHTRHCWKQSRSYQQILGRDYCRARVSFFFFFYLLTFFRPHFLRLVRLSGTASNGVPPQPTHWYQTIALHCHLTTSGIASADLPHTHDQNGTNVVEHRCYQPYTHYQRTEATTNHTLLFNSISRHKETLVTCCAVTCGKVCSRKDHLTQHIRNKHQRLDTKFHCPIAGCTNLLFSLDELFEHMKHVSHKGDVHFSSIKNAAQTPKCSCGDGLIISGRCKACGFHLV